MVLWRFLPNMLQFGAFSRLGFERAALLRGIRLFLERGLGIRRHTFRNCGALARKTVHFHGLRHACEKRCHTCEKDFWDCGELGTIAAQPSMCGIHGERKAANIKRRFQVRVWRICRILFDAYLYVYRLSLFLFYFIYSLCY